MTDATEAARKAMRLRQGMQTILASRLNAQKAMPATALLRHGVSETAIAGVLSNV